MPARTLMIQGTGSHVGKSTLVAALCRIFKQDGFRVAPFKSQNMSNNASVCGDGSEIARSQALQAAACGIEPAARMNPVLLKPEADSKAQVIVLGKPMGRMSALEYHDYKPRLLPVVRESLEALRRDFDIVVIEGAGSPAEINLRAGDIANMKVAEMADAPVLLVGDIDTGGVFAQLIGTLQLLEPAERARLKGFIINKFRGDPSILKPGLDDLESVTSRPVVGVVPYLQDLRLPEEDTPRAGKPGDEQGRLRLRVLRPPHMANFTDFDALLGEADVALRYLEHPEPEVPDAVILPGSKSTAADLRVLKERGFGDYLRHARELGATIVGVCAGCQMLGRAVLDPRGVESEIAREEGFGLLTVETRFESAKLTAPVRALHLESGLEVSGYEMHHGRTAGEAAPVFRLAQRGAAPADELEGARDATGRVWGTAIHGLFENPVFRRHFLNGLRARRGLPPISPAPGRSLEESLDRLAQAVRVHLDMNSIYSLIQINPLN